MPPYRLNVLRSKKRIVKRPWKPNERQQGTPAMPHARRARAGDSFHRGIEASSARLLGRHFSNCRERTRPATSEPGAAGLTAGLRHDEAAGASTSVFELSTLS